MLIKIGKLPKVKSVQTSLKITPKGPYQSYQVIFLSISVKRLTQTGKWSKVGVLTLPHMSQHTTHPHS